MSGESGKFDFTAISDGCYCDERKPINLDVLYKHAYDELTLQQTKRDQIIHIYMLLFSFLVPLLFSLKEIEAGDKGWILLGTSVIGIIFSVIVVRYRVYKEAYWITCNAIIQLNHLKNEALNRDNIQKVFYRCMEKRWSKYVRTDESGTNHFCHKRIFWSHLFSAESLYYIIISLLTSVVSGLSVFLIIRGHIAYPALIGTAITVITFAALLHFYFHNLKRVYKVLVDKQKDSFNFTFSKAWLLHFYRV